MKLERLTPAPRVVADFYDEALTSLGALCERTWHDRLEVVAETRSARLWNDDGALHEVELWFPPAGTPAPREAAREVFPGCPLTFRLAESLRPPLALERVVLPGEAGARPPGADVAEKLWRAQFPDTNRWHLPRLRRGNHFSLLALVRCEIQAIDQHWSLRRLAVSLPDGAPDEALARALDLTRRRRRQARWPATEPARWREFLRAALEADLAADLAAIRDRQSHICVANWIAWTITSSTMSRNSPPARRAPATRARIKTADGSPPPRPTRSSPGRSGGAPRNPCPAHLEALLLIAEPAWRAGLTVVRSHHPHKPLSALFVPRARRWIPASTPQAPQQKDIKP